MLPARRSAASPATDHVVADAAPAVVMRALADLRLDVDPLSVHALGSSRSDLVPSSARSTCSNEVSGYEVELDPACLALTT